MPEPVDELVLYDLTRQRLEAAVVHQTATPHWSQPKSSAGLRDGLDLAVALDAYAYSVCTAAGQGGADWEQTLRDYTSFALERAADNAESKRREVALLRRALIAARARGPILDLGAGWGRLASLYEELGLSAVLAEPATLGLRLMRRSGLRHVVRAQGEKLPFAQGVFMTAIIGWVLHHPPSSTVDPATIVTQAAQVMASGGLLLSVEPVRTGFEVDQWTDLLNVAGFRIETVESFFETRARNGELERHTLTVSRRAGRD